MLSAKSNFAKQLTFVLGIWTLKTSLTKETLEYRLCFTILEAERMLAPYLPMGVWNEVCLGTSIVLSGCAPGFNVALIII
jgi:hypothetical protein